MEDFVDTTFGAINVARTAKSAANAAAFLLQENRDDE